MKIRRKLLALTLVMGILLGCFGAAAFAEEGKTHIDVAGYGTFTLTNAEGQTLYTETTSTEPMGTMPCSDLNWSVSVPAHFLFSVPKSESYVFEPQNNDIGKVDLLIQNLKEAASSETGGFSIDGIGIKKVSVTGDEVKLTGEKIKCTVTAVNRTGKNWYTLSGKGAREITFQEEGGKLTAKGIFGTYTVSEFDPATGAVTGRQKLTSSEPAPETTVYSDTVPGAWYEKAVQYAELDGLMEGVGNGKFAPKSPLTRGQLAKILHVKSWYGDPIIGDNNFTDVPKGIWYEKAVIWANESGIVNGFGDGTFRPDRPVTREQMACMLYRYADSPKTSGTLNAFTDRGKVSGYAVTALNWAVENGIITGKGNGILDPRGNVTRAEAAQMLMRYAEKIG